MSVELKVPVLPESVADATVGTWHKKPGDTVRRDENLVDLETDKVVLEVPSPCDGTLTDIRQESGAVVTNDEILATIEEGAVAEEPAQTPAETPAQTPAEAPAAEAAAVAGGMDELSPAVRRLVEENQLDPTRISGTGRDGRLTKEDVLNHMKGKAPAPAPRKAAPPQPAATPGERSEERVPMSRLRQRVAERMVDANNSAAMLTSFNEVNLQAVMDLRKTYKEAFAQRHGVKLGFMSFFVKACADALRKYPVVNASIDGGDIVYHGFQDIGIAVSTERGLMVPILRDAGQMSFAEVEQAIAGYAEQARDGSIRLEDLQGGTFTITNGGVFGSLVSTPILNMPQSAILGMHAIKERPVAENGEVVIRPMMYLALTYDHRLIDGKDAVLFLVAVKEALEDPARMVLGI